MPAAAPSVGPSDVLLYYPNLIGYLRIACVVAAFFAHCYHGPGAWSTFLIFYLLAFGGDVVDGYVARLFKQQSVFGGVLDMVTDRVSTCGLLTILASTPRFHQERFYFIMLIVLDIFSHWFHVASVQGEHHKSSEALQHRNPLLQWYYSIYPLFGFCCVGTELFYVYLYYISSSAAHPPIFSPSFSKLLFHTGLTACLLKQLVNIVQLSSAAVAIAEKDAITAMKIQTFASSPERRKSINSSPASRATSPAPAAALEQQARSASATPKRGRGRPPKNPKS